MTHLWTFTLLAFAMGALGNWIGSTGTETKIIGTCLVAREVQLNDTIIYCKPIAVMVDGKRQELKNGRVSTTQP